LTFSNYKEWKSNNLSIWLVVSPQGRKAGLSLHYFKIDWANAIRPYTNKDEIDWANAIRPYWRNSTRGGGFRATRTLRVSAACAQRKRLCRRGFNRPVFKPKIQPAEAGFALRARYALAQLARSANVCV